MSYIGAKELKASDIRRFDVTGSTSATHTLTWTAPTEQSLIVTINGVKQQEDAYSVSGTTLTLTSALFSTDKLEVIGINDIGTTITPAQNSVTADTIADDAVTVDKLNLISTGSVPSLEAKGTSGVTDGYIQLNCAENSHGIKLKSPPHSAGASYTLTFPNDDGDADQKLTTNGSGVLTWEATASTGLSSVQTFTSSGTWTRPTGITKVIMEVQGAGGGGGKGANGDYNVSGGAGGYCKKLLDVSSISSATITVGSGGAGTGYGTTGDGGDGGASSWSDGTNTITGGGAGGGPNSYYGTGDGGTASGGDINIVGQCGSVSYLGGSSQFGQCGHFGNINLSTVVGMRNGTGYGAGGANWSGYSQDCGSGSGGIVIVWEYK